LGEGSREEKHQQKEKNNNNKEKTTKTLVMRNTGYMRYWMRQGLW
jgi:hypothetical protein